MSFNDLVSQNYGLEFDMSQAGFLNHSKSGHFPGKPGSRSAPGRSHSRQKPLECPPMTMFWKIMKFIMSSGFRNHSKSGHFAGEPVCRKVPGSGHFHKKKPKMSSNDVVLKNHEVRYVASLFFTVKKWTLPWGTRNAPGKSNSLQNLLKFSPITLFR